MGCISVKESVFCPVAKLVMAFRWSSLIDSLGLYNTRMDASMVIQEELFSFIAAQIILLQQFSVSLKVLWNEMVGYGPLLSG